MIVELAGLQIFGYHGVEDEEQQQGQLFLFDVQLEVGDRGSTTGSSDAVDYTQVASAIRELSETERFDLLEALATRTAAMLLERFAPRSVRVRVRKPEVEPAGLTVEYSRRDRRAAVTLAYVGLGLEPRRPRVADPRSRRADRRGDGSRRIIETEPWGIEDQPLFLNAVAEVETELERASSCSTCSLDVERRLGRERERRRAGGRGRSTSTSCSSATRRSTSLG